MISCSVCDRLIRPGEGACPFCGQTLRAAPVAVALMGLALGCGPVVGSDGTDGADATTMVAADASTNGGPTTLPPDPSTTAPDGSTTSPGSSTTFGGETETGDDTNTTQMSSGFIYGPPGDFVDPIECDVWEQDCQDGEKCMPWANDGGTTWNATRCTPIADDPDGVGDPCTAEGSFHSGIDSCDIRAICSAGDEKTLEGVCYEMCSGTPDNRICNTPNTVCQNDGDLIPVCLAVCDPLLADCGDAQVCIPGIEEWGCAEQGDSPVGGPCNFLNACVAGAACVQPDAACPEGSPGCCASMCDLSAAEPDLACADGQTCTPYYEEGEALAGYEDVGVCITPA